MNPLYTYGYSGGSVEDLLAYAAAGALILDVRFSPNSHRPQWRSAALAKVLGTSYEHCGSLGNMNYRNGGPICIFNWSAGLTILETRLSHRSVVLLCSCREWESCHRRTVAETAAARTPGLTARHLAPGDALVGTEPARAPQPALFDVPGEAAPQRAAGTLPALSLWQPWATLMALGVKRIETRSYPAERIGLRRGALVAIHATKTWNRDVLEWLMAPDPDPEAAFIRQTLGEAGYGCLADLPAGAVVSVHRYQESLPTEQLLRVGLSREERHCGDYGAGRYGWIMPRVHRLAHPIPCRGAQGLWRWQAPEEALAALQEGS